jgi:hypothetical protein
VRFRIVWPGLLSLTLMLLAACGTIPAPRPGELLYLTTFDAYNDDWQQLEGRLAYQVVGAEHNPAMQIAIDVANSGTFTIMEFREFSDFDLIVNATQVAGPDDNGYGVIFRHQDNQNYYVLMISGDGYYQVLRRLEGVDEVLSDWAPTPVIQQGQATNAVRVVAQGDTFTFFINDEQVPLCPTLWHPVSGDCVDAEPTMQLVDDSFSQGRIGLAARSFDDSGVVISFDNLLVCGPQETPPLPYRCEETSE